MTQNKLDISGVFFLATGGTIDAVKYGKGYDALHPPKFVETHEATVIPRILAALGIPLAPGQCQQMPKRTGGMKDSQAFTDEDIRVMAEMIAARPERSVVVTHGTSWMPVNSRRLRDALANMPNAQDKTVVFTGAMVPLSMTDADGASSDGLSNLTEAVRASKKLLPGVFALHEGKIYNIDDFAKREADQEFVGEPVAEFLENRARLPRAERVRHLREANTPATPSR